MNSIKHILFALGAVVALCAAPARAEYTFAPNTVTVSGSGTWAMAISQSNTVNTYGVVSTSTLYGLPVLKKTAGDTTDVLVFPIPNLSFGDNLITGFRKVTADFVVTGASLDAAPTQAIRGIKFVSGQRAVTDALSEASDACIDASAAAITTAQGHYRCTVTLSNRVSLKSKERYFYELTVNGGGSTTVYLTGLTVE